MLGIIGIILKMIGWILLVVLLVFLLLLCILLFVPITYKIEAQAVESKTAPLESKEDCVLSDIGLRAKAGWLFGFVRLLFTLDKNGMEKPVFLLRGKLLCFTIFKFPKAEKSGESEENPGDASWEKETQKEKKNRNDENPQIRAEEKQKGEEVQPEEKKNRENNEENSDKNKTKNRNTDPAENRKENKEQEGFLEKINKKWELFCEDSSQNALLTVKSAICTLLKHIRPQKTCVNVVYGTGDAEKTGKIYAAYCSLLYPMYHDTIDFEPDFCNKIILGDGKLSGRIYLIVPVVLALRLLFCKDIHRTIKKLKKG